MKQGEATLQNWRGKGIIASLLTRGKEMSFQKPLTNFRLNKNVIVVKVYFIFENLLAILRNNIQEIVVYSLKEEGKKKANIIICHLAH